MFLAEGFEETEAITPADLLRRAGVEVCLVSLNETAAVTGSHGISLTADVLFDQCSWEDASMLVLPGGKAGTENLERHGPLALLLGESARRGVPLAAICAAPRVLGQLGLLAGKRACCYPGNEDFLQGARVEDVPVVVDHSVITSRGMGTAFAFGLALVERLRGKDAAAEVARQTMYQC